MGKQSSLRRSIFLSCILAVTAAPLLQASKLPIWPDSTKQTFMYGCKAQPINTPTPITTKQRLSYCTCLYNFTRQYVRYEDYMRIEQMVRNREYASIGMNFPNFPQLFETGTTACAQRYILQQ